MEEQTPSSPYYRECLRNELRRRLSRNPHYSLRAFARSLGIPVSSLSRTLAGQRALSLESARKVATSLSLVPRERSLFFASLADRPGAVQADDDAPTAVDDDAFSAIADWYHYAILEMTYLKSFRADPRYLSARLGITPLEASMALERLQRLGLLKKNGNIWQKSKRLLWAERRGATSDALQAHQRQSLEKALDALDHIPFERRTSSTMVMPIDPAKVPLARRLIEEFALDLCRALSAKNVSDVYQLTVSFHSLLQGGGS